MSKAVFPSGRYLLTVAQVYTTFAIIIGVIAALCVLAAAFPWVAALSVAWFLIGLLVGGASPRLRYAFRLAARSVANPARTLLWRGERQARWS
jgi:uncharacterized membrane protein